MFVLLQPHLPQSAPELAAALEAGLRVFASRTETMVQVEGDELRDLTAISADLTGATIRPEFRLPSVLESPSAPPPVVARRLSIRAAPAKLLERDVNFQLAAKNVSFRKTTAGGGNLLLVPQRAEEGTVRLAMRRADLENLLADLVRQQAGKHGVTIDGVRLDLIPRGPRALDAKVLVNARKMLFRTGLDITGTIAVSDAMVATMNNLRCTGDGAIASLACAAITAQFERLEGCAFPLTAQPLGEVLLQDVAFGLDAGNVCLMAKFGSA